MHSHTVLWMSSIYIYIYTMLLLDFYCLPIVHSYFYSMEKKKKKSTITITDNNNILDKRQLNQTIV